MKVSYLPLGRLNSNEFLPGIDAEVLSAFKEADYILGKDVEKFEQNFSRFCDASFGIGVGNGLDALSIALRALNIGPGDEVIVPAMTFIATWLAVGQVGATVVPVDIEKETYNIDPELIQEKLTAKTKAIIPVHLYGHPSAMDDIRAVAPKNVALIEDAAQAHGATYKKRKAGGLGDLAAFSFYPSKNLGAAGDAGAILTSSKSLYEKARALRNYGSAKKYFHDTEGANSRLDSIQAKILNFKLKHLSDWNQERANRAAIYLRGITNPRIVLPKVKAECVPSWYSFAIRSKNRDGLVSFLQEHGIDTIIHYPQPPHRSGAYRERFKNHNFAVADEVAATVLSIPLHPLLTKDEQSYVIEKLNAFKG